VSRVATASLSTVESSARRRPHRSLPHRASPATVYQARPKANPGTRNDTHDRVRTGRVDEVRLRHVARPAACTTSASAEPVPEPAS
jgi:hypothetical protein